MKFVILGGTHGNEFTGVEVLKLLKQQNYSSSFHTYDCILANPKAHEHNKRYIDSDLNRAFGNNGSSIGYEKERSRELKEQIQNNYDFVLDLHTTTSEMGLTIIITRNDLISIKAACYIQDNFPDVKLITTDQYNEETPYTTAMTNSGLIVEVGAVPHNVNSAHYIFETYNIVTTLLEWDFESDVDLKREYYQTTKNILYPSEPYFYISPKLEKVSFPKIMKGTTIFKSLSGESLAYEDYDTVYAFFVNEAAYQENDIAMSLARKDFDLQKIMKSST